MSHTYISNTNDNATADMEQQTSTLEQDNDTTLHYTTNTTPPSTTSNPHNIPLHLLETFCIISTQKTRLTKLKCTFNNLEEHQQAQTLPPGLQKLTNANTTWEMNLHNNGRTS